MVDLVEGEIQAVSGGAWNVPGIISALPGIISDIIADYPYGWISTLPMPIDGFEVKPALF
ncbi:hypothetical protein WS68_12490 [Burkholderia sp. TSV86]|nr:hypothetical protein WS68_12490 [Burkholderia sp. TSV86]